MAKASQDSTFILIFHSVSAFSVSCHFLAYSFYYYFFFPFNLKFFYIFYSQYLPLIIKMYAEWHHEQWILTWSMRQALKTTLILIPFSIVYFWESNHSPFHAKRELIKKKRKYSIAWSKTNSTKERKLMVFRKILVWSNQCVLIGRITWDHLSK